MRRYSRDGPIPVNGARRCECCGTILCRFNPTDRCWQSGRWETAQERALRVLDDREYARIVREAVR